MAAAFASAALLAACGTSAPASTSTGTSTTPGAGEFNPQLVPPGGSSPGKNFASKNKNKNGKSSSGNNTQGSGGTGVTAGATTAKPAGVRTIFRTRTQTQTQTHTVTVSHAITHNRTIVKTKVVRPDVPAGASLPSTQRPLTYTRFGAMHGNVGCSISGGSVRCDIAHRVWSPPRRPRSCHTTWGQGLMVGPTGSPGFVCSRSSVLDPTGSYVHYGFDDKVGSVTCQVRSFGVTCFEPDGSGFFIGRTGYTTF